MRRGPRSGVSIVTNCARCGSSPDLYAVRRVRAFIAGRWHDMVVCRSCDQHFGNRESPAMEIWALRLEGTNPLDVMRFAQRWQADLVRVQHTAEFFLGVARYAELRSKYRAEQVADEESRARERAEWEAKHPPREPAPVGDGDDDEDDDDDDGWRYSGDDDF